MDKRTISKMKLLPRDSDIAQEAIDLANEVGDTLWSHSFTVRVNALVALLSTAISTAKPEKGRQELLALVKEQLTFSVNALLEDYDNAS